MSVGRSNIDSFSFGFDMCYSSKHFGDGIVIMTLYKINCRIESYKHSIAYKSKKTKEKFQAVRISA